MQTIIVVSIGRCIGSEPMDSMTWLRFKSDLLQHVDFLADTVLQRPDLSTAGSLSSTQYGVWQGVACEDAAVVMAVIDRDNLPLLRSRLAVLADHYQQDAIGLIVSESGTDTLVCRAPAVLDV